MTMRIVIDLQGAQTESRFRGIGRYTLSLAQAIVRNRGEHEIILALSGLFPDTIEPIRAAFDGLLPQENIRVWYAPGPVLEKKSGNAWRREVAELIREAFLASLRPDVIHVSSLFEGYVDDAVTSIGRFDQSTAVSVSLYDLIPLLNPDHYLKPNPSYRAYYERKVGDLSRASLMLAISEFSRQEGLEYLDAAPGQVVNVSTAIDDHFHPLKLNETDAAALKAKLNITRPFCLYSGGADERKNLLRLIEAYARLAPALRKAHQLVLVGKLSEGDCLLRQTIKQAGLSEEEVCFAGYVSEDELVALYNLCTVFVFPSWHEGFGLPALEAMACGAAVIGASTTSLPEVIGREDALFDPLDVDAIAAKMAKVLEDEGFREDLRAHGLAQAKKFSWNETAWRAIKAFETRIAQREIGRDMRPADTRRLRLAFVSPLPPERTGIADYSAELLPALAEYYELELVVTQASVEDPWVRKHGKVRSVQWFREHAGEIDRVVYQVGNSPFHEHMLALMQEIPGTVVLHDFFLSSMVAHQEMHGGKRYAWAQALYAAHGYAAMNARFKQANVDLDPVVRDYPVNLPVLQHAQGVIVHSEYSRGLAKAFYGPDAASEWRVIPLLRVNTEGIDPGRARAELSIAPSDFVVCSFGFLAPTKLNHRLLQAWLQSKLGRSVNCKLIFVGENHSGEYGASLLKTIREHGLEKRVWITGFAKVSLFRNYLAAADLAVQLRTSSRGETSAAMLDCMNHGIATIVNANGSIVELPTDAIWMLPDEFEDDALVEALETLWQDMERRKALGRRARDVIQSRHAPASCARQYAEAIEGFYHAAEIDRYHLARAIAAQDSLPFDERAWQDLASCIAQNQPDRRPARNLFVDVTATSRSDLKTGIERVARALLLELINVPPAGYRVESVYLTDQGGRWHYRYARRYTLELLECPSNWLDDEPIDVQPGDVLFGVDLAGHMVVEAERAGVYQILKQVGVSIHFMVFDLLPIKMPEFFPPRANESFDIWLRSVCQVSDNIVCISQSVADELRYWIEENPLPRIRPLRVSWIHLGANIDASPFANKMPTEDQSVLTALDLRPTFLMVGTIEPRKGYLQTIAAFDQLWLQGVDVNLAIVGKEGWKDLPGEMRSTIPKIIDTLRHHSERGKCLFWLEGISDEYLEKVYAASTCLIAASEGEGFGLPLIEAAQHNLPIIAREIPVFREVAGKYAYYFSGLDAADLASTIKKWIVLYEQEQNPKSEAMPWLTWAQSAERLKTILFKNTEARRTNLEKKILIDEKQCVVSSDDLYLDHMGSSFEPHMVTLFKNIVLPTDVVVDVGANIGLTTILFSSLARKVISFEASPSTYAILCENINRNAINNAILVNIGLGDKTETTTITFAADNRSGGFVSDMVRPEGGHVTENIELRKLDDICCVFGEPLNFIKIDVEGFEGNVIKGGHDVINKFRPTVVLELNHWCLNAFRRITVPDFFDFLRSVFPVLYAVDSDNTSIMNLHNHDEAYYVMHEHIVKWRFLNIVAGFDEALIKCLRKV
jgi:FkbM family methyltransferase